MDNSNKIKEKSDKKSSLLFSIKEKLRSFKSSNFAKKVADNMRKNKVYYLSFALPFLIMLLVYIVMEIFPFGERSVLTLDMNAQYIYYFEQLRDVFTGKASIVYTFERAMGGEFLGFYTYYLASPLSLIVLLFPSSMITEAVMLMMLIKCGLSGFTFSYYIKKTRGEVHFSCVAFAVMYALCGYVTSFQTNTMWMDALIWLPIITLGIEKIITEGKFKLYTVSLAVAVWSNYYIGYMICIYVVIYFLFYLFSHSNEELNKLGEKRHTLRSFLRIGICSFVAVLSVSAVILTAYYSLTFGKSSFQDTTFTSELRFDFINLFTKLFVGSYDTVRPDGLPNIYCGILTLMFLPVYYISKKTSAREKIAYTLVVLVFVVSFSINAVDLVWHGFQKPVWLNYRYSFMFSFLLLIMAYKGFEALSETEYKTIGKIGAFLLAALVVIQRISTLPRRINGETVEDMPDYLIIWTSLGFVLAYLLVIWIVKNSKLKTVASTVLIAVVCLEGFASSLINWSGEVSDVGWAKRENYRSYIDGISPSVDYIYNYDSSFYRFEKTSLRKPNDNFALDIRGLSSSTSTLHKAQITFLRKLGFASKSHWSKYFEGNPVSDSLLGVKYLIADKDVNSNYIKIGEEGDYSIYQNPYALSIAYAVNSQIKDMVLEDDDVHSAFTFTEQLISAMLGEEDYEIFTPCDYKTGSYSTNCYVNKSSTYYEIRRTDEDKSCTFYFYVTANEDGNIYMNLPSPYTTKATLYVEGSKVSELFTDDNARVFNLGYFNKGETISVKIEFDYYRLAIYKDGAFFVQINQEKFEEAMETLKQNELKIENYSDTKFEGTITADSDKTVFTTIPYDKNWKVYIDGEKVEAFECVDSMVAFDITEGEHTVVLKYVPTEMYIGLVLGAVGITLFVLMCVFEKKFKPKKEEEKNDLSC